MSKFLIGVIPNNSFIPTMTKELQLAGYNEEHIAVITKPEDVKVFTKEKSGFFKMFKKGLLPGSIGGAIAGFGFATIYAFIQGRLAIATMSLSDYLYPTLIIALYTVIGALLSAITGGLITALMDSTTTQDIESYKNKLEQGNVLVGVPVSEENEDNVKKFFEAHRAEKIQKVTLKTGSNG